MTPEEKKSVRAEVTKLERERDDARYAAMKAHGAFMLEPSRTDLFAATQREDAKLHAISCQLMATYSKLAKRE